MYRLTILLPLLALASPLAAEPGLPDEAAIGTALDTHPSVIAARARLEAAQRRAEGLKANPHEFTISGGYTQRSVDREGDFNEYDAQLSRGIRLPGKGRLDKEIGQQGVEAALNLAEDAKHQAALLLASNWFDWLSASAQARVDQAAVVNYEKALAAVSRRMQLRDASQLEVDQAAAALAAARLAAEQSNGLARLARIRLDTHFPSLPLPVEAPELSVPEISEARLSQLRDNVIANSHEIAAATAEARRMEAVAARARKDRLADPTLGLRLFSERNGAERGAGVVLSMPLGGGYRKAVAEEAGAGASAARAEEQLARFRVQETADADAAEARYRIAAWQRARESIEAQMAALAKLRRGHQLGEIDLGDLLLGERMVHEAFRIEATSRAEAVRAITKLRIDSHELWLAD